MRRLLRFSGQKTTGWKPETQQGGCTEVRGQETFADCGEQAPEEEGGPQGDGQTQKSGHKASLVWDRPSEGRLHLLQVEISNK